MNSKFCVKKWRQNIAAYFCFTAYFIQQDNAKPHIKVDDAEFLQEASRDGFDIRLCFQPPNSPDLNVLELSFFQAIQSRQEQKGLGND